jgi:protein O-mannosyl-transferase
VKHRSQIYLILAFAAALAYSRVPTLGFTNFDDPGYVTRNPHVQAGITASTLVWAFTTTEQSNWHPLTWLSHMLDCSIFGLNAAGHHLTSLLFHIAATLLLFAALARMTRAPLPSAAVAALFALHPLHVESVAWVAERKDVLSAFFAMLTLYGYARYAEHRSKAWYAALLVSFTLGLLAKPMLVTLPFLLLLLDYWPLGRWAKPWPRLVLEKVPMLALSAVSSVVTYLAQQSGGSVVSLHRLPFSERLGNAAVSWVVYLRKTVWPFDLAVFYPRAVGVESWTAVLAALFLTAVTVIVLRLRREKPYLAVGWLWYVGTLVPVIGLVQVGEQALADRYTYIPLIGVFVMLAWSLPGMATVVRLPRAAVASAVAAVFFTLGGLTWAQSGYWKDSESLFMRAIAVTGENELAYLNFGAALASEGKFDDAARLYGQYLEHSQGTPDTRANYGMILMMQGRMADAEAQFRQALAVEPSHAESHNGLAAVLIAAGRVSDAAKHAQAAVDTRAALPEARYNLGRIRAAQADPANAIEQFQAALQIRPEYPEAHYALGLALYQRHERTGAVLHLREALRLRPGWPEAMNNLAWMLATSQDATDRDAAESVGLARESLRLSRNADAGFLDTYAAACARTGSFAEAVAAAGRAAQAARSAGDASLAAEIESRCALYRSGRIFREER